ncbi:MAG: hypothetical protein P4K93_12020 [Terracidiphilus sp.]|nr:hypothetical protein [Terracidiphilus sp.]MDR3798877.1 hypothetical protein [Terracidiphilus sp.]
MKNRNTYATRAFSAALFVLLVGSVNGFTATDNAPPPDRFLALHIAQNDAATGQMLYRYGMPFFATPSHPVTKDVIQAAVGVTVKKIFLLGLIETQRPSAWSSPLTYASRYIVGDNLGNIRLHYADGSTEDYPLILGESVWWGLPFYQTREPFPIDARLRNAFMQSMRLYPAAPVDDGNYVAVIAPKDSPLASIEITNSPEKHGSVAISGITVEVAPDARVPGSLPIAAGDLTPEFRKFVAEKSLRPTGVDEAGSKKRLTALSDAFYSTDADFKAPIAAEIPARYSGPRVIFKGNNYAAALQNAYYANVQDMLDKIDADGTYHTSTRNALSWAGDPRSAGGEFGTFRKNVGVYYGDAWSRDLGRTMQELTELGFLSKTTPAADFAFRSARSWLQNPSLNYKGVSLPPHWNRVINHPDFAQPFENDGHGLIALFIYKLWQRVPDRDAWLRARWPDVKAAGDWIPWQFDHADITGAKDGVLYTTGESAAGKGYSVYPDAVCMTALEALAQMAESIGETQSAALWRDRAAKMRAAISAHYAISDPKYGHVWTLDYAGWPNQSTVLGPLIFLADYRGLAPQDDDPAWRPVNQAAYQRLIDTYRPFGFYGWAMGYGQGFVTQAALLLDRMKDVTPMLNWTARETYDAEIHSFVVPEGVQVDPTGRYVFRTGDQGNGVQEAEIVKIFRLLICVDDNLPQRLRIMPRLPYGWTEISVSKYPALLDHNGNSETALLRYDLRRTGRTMTLVISADRPLGPVSMRLGPFAHEPAAADVLVNGKHPSDAIIAQSGDSWWVSITTVIGPNAAAAAN